MRDEDVTQWYSGNAGSYKQKNPKFTLQYGAQD
jgi:hypothetical protein